MGGLPPFVSEQKLDTMFDRFAARHVEYVLGGADRCNDVIYRYSPTYGHQCNAKCWKKAQHCHRQIMDARCGAMLQGPWRHWRGTAYFDYLKVFYGERNGGKGPFLQTLATAPGVGHEAQ